MYTVCSRIPAGDVIYFTGLTFEEAMELSIELAGKCRTCRVWRQ